MLIRLSLLTIAILKLNEGIIFETKISKNGKEKTTKITQNSLKLRRDNYGSKIYLKEIDEKRTKFIPFD